MRARYRATRRGLLWSVIDRLAEQPDPTVAIFAAEEGARREAQRLNEESQPRTAAAVTRIPGGKPGANTEEAAIPENDTMATKSKSSKSSKKPAAKKATKPASPKAEKPFQHDARIPAVGTTIKVERSGKTYEAKVLATGFEFHGKEYRTLSAIAREVLGCAANGFLFFHLGEYAKAAKEPKAPKAPKAKKPAVGTVVPATPREPKCKEPAATAKCDLTSPEGQRQALKDAGITK